ncbi:MAG: Fur family transcriptional regulator [Chloroflexota bacterium]
MSSSLSLPEPWASVRQRLRERGFRWTAQRRAVVEALAGSDGHITGTELIERCRAIDAGTIPSTVYRTLDVLEELGLVQHGHGADGREEFHVGPEGVHGHLHCATCGGRWEIRAGAGRSIVDALRSSDGFEVDLSHVTVVGRCADCAASAAAAQ